MDLICQPLDLTLPARAGHPWHSSPTRWQTREATFPTRVPRKRDRTPSASTPTSQAGARPSTKSPGGTKPNSPGGGSGSGGSGGGGGASESAKETVETFDWVENKLESLERHVKKLDRTVGRAYKGWSERNSALNQEILEVGGQVWGQVLAYQEYMKKADAVGLSEHYKNLVKDGAIAIEDISDEGLKQQISDFTKWYEKARKCEEEAESTRRRCSRTSCPSWNIRWT